VTAAWTLESIFAVTFRSLLIFAQCTHPSITAYLPILTSWAWDGTVFAKPALLAHAFHCIVGSCHTFSLSETSLGTLERARLLADTTTKSFLAKTFGREALLFSISAFDEHTFSLPRTRLSGCPTWAFILAVSSHETLLAFAGCLSILQDTLSLSTTGNAFVLGAYSTASNTEEACFALALWCVTVEGAFTVSTTCDLATSLRTAWAIVFASFAHKASRALAHSSLACCTAFSMAVADVPILIGFALHLTLITCKPFLAYTLSFLCLSIHEARTMVGAYISILLSWALHAAFFPHKSFLTLANSCPSITLLLAHPPFRPTTNATQGILVAL